MGKEQDLLDASRNGHFAVVEKVLSSRIKKSGPLTLTSLRRLPGPNTTDPRNGFTCLHYASLNGHKDIVHLLLEHGANPNIVDQNGSSPLHLASWTGDYEVVKLLIGQGSTGNANHRQSADINLKNKDNETALHSAAQYGHTAVVSLLLSQGADPFIRNIRAETALDLSAQYGRLETIELLLQMRFDLLKDYLPIHRELMSGGSGGIGRHERPPHSPLHLASRNGHKQVVKLLIDLGFDVDFLTSGGTALHEAVLCGKVEVVRLLLEAGSDIFMENDNGQKVDELIAGLNTSVARQTKRLIQEHMRSMMSRSSGHQSGGHQLAFSPVSESTTTLVNHLNNANNSYSYNSALGDATEDLTIVDSIVLGDAEMATMYHDHDFEGDDLVMTEDDTEVECISPPPGYTDQVVPPDVIPQLLEQEQMQFGGHLNDHHHLLPEHAHHHQHHHHHQHQQNQRQQSPLPMDNVSPSSSLFSSSILSELQSIFDEHLNRNSADDQSQRHSQEFTEDPFSLGSGMKPSTSFTLSDYRAQTNNRASASSSDIVAHHQSFDAVYLNSSNSSGGLLLHPLDNVSGGGVNQLMSTSLTSNEANFVGGKGGKLLTKRYQTDSSSREAVQTSSNYSLSSSVSHDHGGEGVGYQNNHHPQNDSTSDVSMTNRQPRPPKPPRKASNAGSKGPKLLSQNDPQAQLLAASVDSLAKSDYNVDYNVGVVAGGLAGGVESEEEEERSMPSQRAPKPQQISNFEQADSDHSSAHLNSVISNKDKPKKEKARSTSVGKQQLKRDKSDKGENGDNKNTSAQTTTSLAFTQSIDDFYLLYDQVANSANSVERSPAAKSSNPNKNKHSSSLDDILADNTKSSRTGKVVSPNPPSPRAAESDIFQTIEPLKQQFQQLQPPVRRKRKKKGQTELINTTPQCQKTTEQAEKRDNWTLTDFPDLETTSTNSTSTFCSDTLQNNNTSPRKRSVAVWTVEASNRENSSLVANRVQVKKKVMSEGRKTGDQSTLNKGETETHKYNAYCETLHFDRKGEKENPFAGLCRGGLTPAHKGKGSSQNNSQSQPTAPERAKKKTVELSEARKSLRGKRAILTGRAESLTKLSKLSVYQPETSSTTTTSTGNTVTTTNMATINNNIGPVENIYATLRKSKKKCKSLNGDQISTSLAGLASSVTDNSNAQQAASFDTGTGSQHAASIGLVGSESWNNLLKVQSARGRAEAGRLESASSRAANSITRTAQLYRWLKELGMEMYKDLLIANGYDDLHFMDANVMDDSDLLEIGIINAAHREVILSAASQLPKTAPKLTKAEIRTLTVPEWLSMLHLEQYRDSFARNGIDELRKVHNIWEVELETMLEIDKSGYRRRIMYSLSDFNRESILMDDDDIASWLTDVQSSANETEKENGGQSDGQIINNSEANKEGSKPWKEWKHPRQELLSGACQYSVRYLGSTLVRELRGIDSTRASMGKLKSAHATVPPMQIPKIILSISCQGVQFRDFKSNHLICEHEIRNIHCICQDSEDLNYFAYITKDLESNNHYCHVFMSQQTDLVTEIILTLGQAFEIAYQIVLEQYNIHVTAANEVQVTTNTGGSTPAANSNIIEKRQSSITTPTIANGSSTNNLVPQETKVVLKPQEESKKAVSEVTKSADESANVKAVKTGDNEQITSAPKTTIASSSSSTTAASNKPRISAGGSKLNFFKQKNIASQVFLVAAKFKAMDEASQDAMLETGEAAGDGAEANNNQEINTVKYGESDHQKKEESRTEEVDGAKKKVDDISGQRSEQPKSASNRPTSNHPINITTTTKSNLITTSNTNTATSTGSNSGSISEDIYAVVDKSKKVRRRSSITSNVSNSTSDYQTVAGGASDTSVTPEPSGVQHSVSRPVPPVRSTSTTGRPEIKPKPPMRVASMSSYKPEVSPKPKNLTRETATPTPPLGSVGIYSRGNVKPSIAARQALLISSTSPQPPMTPSPAPSH